MENSLGNILSSIQDRQCHRKGVTSCKRFDLQIEINLLAVRAVRNEQSCTKDLAGAWP